MFQDAAAGGLTEMLTNAAKPWSKLYSHSKAVSSAVSFFHLAPLIFGAGAAFITDRATLRAVKMGTDERERHLVELGRIHNAVLLALTLSFVSGILMFLSDVETFIGSIYFWIKLALVGVLLVNGFVMTRVEQSLASTPDDEALWMHLRTVAILSGVLWLATTLAGVVLKEYA